MASRPLRVVLEASCLADARRDAGIGRYARELRTALDRLEEVSVVAAVPKHAPRSEARPLRYVQALPRVLRVARYIGPDLLHAVGGEPVAGFPAARQVVTVHDVELWRDHSGASPAADAGLRVYRAVLERLLRRCAAIITPSQATAVDAVATLGLDSRRITVIAHGVSPIFSAEAADDDAQVRSRAGIADRPYVLWIGSLRHHDPRKGIDHLLEAMSRLGQDAPALVLAGRRGEEAARVSRAARRLGVVVLLCGYRPDSELAAVYRGAAVVVIPSGGEGFGLPMLEAMASGVPVVASAAGHLAELGQGAALLVPPQDAAALTGALRTVLEDPGHAQRLREAGRRRAAAYRWERTAEQTADVYRRAASLSSPRSSGR